LFKDIFSGSKEKYEREALKIVSELAGYTSDPNHRHHLGCAQIKMAFADNLNVYEAAIKYIIVLYRGDDPEEEDDLYEFTPGGKITHLNNEYVRIFKSSTKYPKAIHERIKRSRYEGNLNQQTFEDANRTFENIYKTFPEFRKTPPPEPKTFCWWTVRYGEKEVASCFSKEAAVNLLQELVPEGLYWLHGGLFLMIIEGLGFQILRQMTLV